MLNRLPDDQFLAVSPLNASIIASSCNFRDMSEAVRSQFVFVAWKRSHSNTSPARLLVADLVEFEVKAKSLRLFKGFVTPLGVSI